MMRFVILVALFGCGKSNEEQLREQIERDQKRAVGSETEAKVEKRELPPSTKDAAPPEPEPTTPEEIDKARMQAMIDGRDKDVIKYCEAGNVTPDKSDGQVLLGCTLAACRIKQEDKARAWAAGLLRNKKDKPLHDQAKKTCLANQVGI